ncbi:ATPase [Pseudofrankia asymbiotica]|uniref:ATPase n=1 Tax=Pseudofrankia asymbiotica TaxID=1834516 RepID=A0A1V2I055_9ACTN|nr:MoxR family ATPase [Pseudofrankia asymbiotica]ONH22431.1 ATPase [Pseudofrankia asymbiotica]
MPEELATAADVAWFAERCDRIVRNIERLIRGKTDVVRLAVLCMAAEGHVLIDDVPGVGKTSIAKALAGSIEGSMRRIQCTPDLLPTDVTGVQIWNAQRQEFEFQPGAVFGNVVLADEVNRASPKTQSALLEVMEEGQVTVDGVSHLVPRPFLVIATQNPVEHGGTYDLPEAQIDRFMVRLTVGYPAHEAEVEIVTNRSGGQSVLDLTPVVASDDVVRMTAILRGVHLTPTIVDYIVTITAATRRLPELRLGASPRAGIALAVAAQAHAAADSRTFVTPDDVKALAPYVLGHRLLLRPEAELGGATAPNLLDGILASVPVPGLRPAYR